MGGWPLEAQTALLKTRQGGPPALSRAPPCAALLDQTSPVPLFLPFPPPPFFLPFASQYDNNGKDLEACRPLIDHFKVRVGGWALLTGGRECVRVRCPPSRQQLEAVCHGKSSGCVLGQLRALRSSGTLALRCVACSARRCAAPPACRPAPPARSCRCPQGRVKHYVFVGSAGAYEANKVEPMHVEGDKRKASAGARALPPRRCGSRQPACLQRGRAGGCACPAERPPCAGSRAWAAPAGHPPACHATHPAHTCALCALCGTTGHVAVEQYLQQQFLPYTVFQPAVRVWVGQGCGGMGGRGWSGRSTQPAISRLVTERLLACLLSFPQYIYGPHTAKDCEQVGGRRRAACTPPLLLSACMWRAVFASGRADAALSLQELQAARMRSSLACCACPFAHACTLCGRKNSSPANGLLSSSTHTPPSSTHTHTPALPHRPHPPALNQLPQWFMGRILRDRPVPIPAPGVQLTSLSHVSPAGRGGGPGQTRGRVDWAAERCERCCVPPDAGCCCILSVVAPPSPSLACPIMVRAQVERLADMMA